jgi:hypothetical protein
VTSESEQRSAFNIIFANMATAGTLPCDTKQQNLPAKSEAEQNSAGNLQIVYANK